MLGYIEAFQQPGITRGRQQLTASPEPTPHTRTQRQLHSPRNKKIILIVYALNKMNEN
jgi:hypothetical protein